MLLLFIICVISVLFPCAFVHICLLVPCGCLLGVGGGGGGWPLGSCFVVSDCDIVTFPLVFWVGCGA